MMIRNTSIVLLTLCLTGAPFLAAQTRFAEHAREHLPRVPSPTQGVAMGDLDGDGDLDVVLANYAVQNRLLLNNGRGIFTDVTAARLPADSDYSLGVALGDMDGNGSLDIVFANHQQQTRLLLNDGRGTFRDATAGRMPPGTSDRIVGLTAGDVDGDGDIDLVIAADGNQTRLFANDGTGVFTDRTAGRIPAGTDRTHAVALADLDGDGQPDLLLANYGEQAKLYLNRGLGVFADETAARMPIGSWACTSVALGDVNGDGFRDIVLGATGERKRLLVNDGRGYFSDQSARIPADLDPTLAVRLGDFDRDGDLDLLTGNCGNPFGHQNRYFVNDGRGNFTDATATRMPVDSDYTTSLAVGDVDGDGDLDALIGSSGPWWQQSRLYLNDGAGGFLDGSAENIAQERDITRALAVGDVNGDGCPDVVFGNRGTQNRLLLGNDKTGLVDRTAVWMPAEFDNTQALALGDVDGDGRPDLVVGNDQQQARLYLNSGTRFVDATTSRMPVTTADMVDALALGDVDRDGDLDLVIGNYSQSCRLYLNDGRGNFSDASASRMPAALALTAAVVLVDVDGDGDLDLVLGNSGQNNLFVNDGTGRFTDTTSTRLPVDNDFTAALAAGDVDRDGDQDLMLGNLGQNRLYLNDGTGRFTDATATRLPVDAGMTFAIALGDLDEDGDPDVIFGNDHDQNTFYLNDGTGRFTDVTAGSMPFDKDPTFAVGLGDMDRDGDVDIVFGNAGPCVFFCNPEANRFLVNLRRQIHLPFIARTRDVLPLRISVDRIGSSLPGVAIPFLSLGELTPHLPVPMLGFLGVDPALGLTGPIVLANGPGDTATFSFTLPDEVAGTTLYLQAVFLHTANIAHWRLGNLLAARVIR